MGYNFNMDQIKGIKLSDNSSQGLMLMMYTCKVCDTKQARTFSKESY